MILKLKGKARTNDAQFILLQKYTTIFKAGNYQFQAFSRYMFEKVALNWILLFFTLRNSGECFIFYKILLGTPTLESTIL